MDWMLIVTLLGLLLGIASFAVTCFALGLAVGLALGDGGPTVA